MTSNGRIEMTSTFADPSSVPSAIAREPGRRQRWSNHTFLFACRACAWASTLLVLVVVGQIAIDAAPAIQMRGVSFLTDTVWDPNQDRYAILPEIWGTIYSSLLALTLGTFFGIAVALFLSEGFLSLAVARLVALMGAERHPTWARLPDNLERTLRNLLELLAAIPSVVYGLWGIYVVIPAIRPLCNALHDRLGFIGIFGTSLSGPGMLPASLVLAIMILPTVSALSRDALSSVPSTLRMAAYGLGATRWETISAVIVPTAARGLFGAIVIALGRALGETMALAMLVGNANVISVSLFSPANTLAALLANNFPEAGPVEVGLLMYAALVLLAITLVVNGLGALMMLRITHVGR